MEDFSELAQLILSLKQKLCEANPDPEPSSAPKDNDRVNLFFQRESLDILVAALADYDIKIMNLAQQLGHINITTATFGNLAKRHERIGELYNLTCDLLAACDSKED